MEEFYNKREHLEKALYNWLDEIDNVQKDIEELIENNNIPKSRIAKDIGKMKNRFMTVQNNLKRF